MATLTIADLDNGKRDLQTVDEVANSRAATATTRFGQQTTTLYESIRRINATGDEILSNLGFRVPVPYASGLNVTDSRFTVTGPDGKVYAPLSAPFTTGTWDPSQWYVLQNIYGDHNLLVFESFAEASAAAATLPDGRVVHAPNAQGNPSRYRVQDNALVFQGALRSTVNVKDFGAVGDGVTDDTGAIETAIQACKLSGGTLHFPSGSYFVSSMDLDGITVVAANAEFVFDASSEVLWGALATVNDCDIDRLNIQCQATALDAGYVLVVSGNASIGSVSIQSVGNRLGEGVYVCGSNVSIGSVDTRNVDRPLNITSLQKGGGSRTATNNISIGSVNGVVYRRGMMIDGVSNVRIGGAVFSERSPNAVGSTPGENAVLIQGSTELNIGDVVSSDSSETAVRIGGLAGYQTKNVSIGTITAIRPLNNALKINDGIGSGRVTSVRVAGVIAVDVGHNLPQSTNRSVLRISHADKVSIGPVLYRKETSTTFAIAGAELNDCKDIVISSLSLSGCRYGILCSATNDTDETITGGNIEGLVIPSMLLHNVEKAFAISFGASDHYVTGVRTHAVIRGANTNLLDHYGPVSPDKKNYFSFELENDASSFDQIYIGSAGRSDDIMTVVSGTNIYSGFPVNGLFGSRVVEVPQFAAGDNKRGGMLLTNLLTPSGEGLYGPAITFAQINTSQRGAAVALKQYGGTTRSSGLAFFCGPSAAGSDIKERANLRYDGVFHPAGDNTQSLGVATYRWSVVYAGTGTINTSDEREKQDIAALSEAEKRVAVALKGLVRKFRFKDAIQAKGDEARTHIGVIAQDVKAAFESEGLDPFAYAILCYDEWNEQQEVVDENGEITQQYRPAGNRYGVRYEELLAFIISAL